MDSNRLNTKIYIGLGSNLESPRQQVTSAIEELVALPDIFDLRASSLYQSSPIGPSDQPDYINAAVEVSTPLTPAQLLATLQGLENLHERKRLIRWGPRTLDLDLLVWHQQTVNTPTLTIPHPECCNRDFVLVPLYELNPDLLIPNFGKVSQLIDRLASNPLKKLAPS